MNSTPAPTTGATLDVVLAAIEHDRTARGIAGAVNRLIGAGVLPVDTRLPTVRDLARRLGVSPTTVSDAWQQLAAVGAVRGRGRLGTFVSSPTGPGAPTRYRRITGGTAHFAIDLSTGTPDPALLPDLAAAVGRIGRQALTTSYLDPPVLPELEDELRRRWPFEPAELTVVDGAMDALDRVAQQVVRLGDRVVVEQPTFPPLLDLLDHLGAEVIGVPLDDQGMAVTPLRAALAERPAAVICQLRAHNPTGVSTTPGRATQLAALLADVDSLVIEDDHSGDISSCELVSIGRWLPERTVLIRSFSKSHGPDLRLAAIGGAATPVLGVANRRLLGAGWTSRILQAVCLQMLTDASTSAAVDAARATYAARRAAVCAGLDRAGVHYTGTDGINLWVAVHDERAAMLALAAQGIGVAPGEPFMAAPSDRHWIRVTVGMVPESDAADLARRLADAAQLPPTWG